MKNFIKLSIQKIVNLSKRIAMASKSVFIALSMALWLLICTFVAAILELFYAGLICPWITIHEIKLYFGFTVLLQIVLVFALALGWPRNRRWFTSAAIRGFSWASAGLLSLVVLFYSIEKWRGKRQWNQVVAAASARGENLSVLSLHPDPVSDDLNFAKIPFVAPLNDFVERMGDRRGGWRDPAKVKRLENISIHGQSNHKKLNSNYQSWATGKPLSLGELANNWKMELSKAQNTNRDAGKTNVVSSGQSPSILESIPGDGDESARAMLSLLDAFSEELSTIQAAAETHPGCRFPLAYEKGMFMNVPQHPILRDWMQVFCIRAIAEVRLGRGDAALADIKTALKLADYNRQLGGFMSGPSWAKYILFCVRPIWEGIEAGKWTGPQLDQIRMLPLGIQPLNHYQTFLREEIWREMDLINQLVPIAPPTGASNLFKNEDVSLFLWMLDWGYPKGWSFQDQALNYRLYERELLVVEPALGRIHMENHLAGPQLQSLDIGYAVFISPKINECMKGILEDLAYSHTTIMQALIACSLEEYRLEHGQYPQSLNDMSPSHPFPSDPFNGQPFKYLRPEPDRYTLYSVGWNQTDEGGQVHFYENGNDKRLQLNEGDWAWVMPSRSKK